MKGVYRFPRRTFRLVLSDDEYSPDAEIKRLFNSSLKRLTGYSRNVGTELDGKVRMENGEEGTRYVRFVYPNKGQGVHS